MREYPLIPSSTPQRPGRIAVVLQGDPTSPQSWSGAPAGLFGGLEAAGAKALAIDARMPGGGRLADLLRMPWTAQTTNPIFATLGGARASLALRRGEIDAAVAIGSGYSLRTGKPLATFEDMTVAQALAQPGSVYEGIGARSARRWLERQRRIYAASRACCVSSRWAADSLRDDYGVDPAKIHVVGFGRNSAEQVVDRDWTVPRFVFIGIDWERKQGPAVLEAFAKVREKHPGASLDLIGGHPSIDAPGVRGHGVLARDSAADSALQARLLAAATCHVLPSKFEPFGIAYVDAAASGVPSIGTTNGGAATAIGDGGLLVDPADRAALLEAMLAMCDPIAAEQLGKRAFSHSAGFTWQGVAERVISALALE